MELLLLALEVDERHPQAVDLAHTCRKIRHIKYSASVHRSASAGSCHLPLLPFRLAHFCIYIALSLLTIVDAGDAVGVFQQSGLVINAHAMGIEVGDGPLAVLLPCGPGGYDTPAWGWMEKCKAPPQRPAISHEGIDQSGQTKQSLCLSQPQLSNYAMPSIGLTCHTPWPPPLPWRSSRGTCSCP